MISSSGKCSHLGHVKKFYFWWGNNYAQENILGRPNNPNVHSLIKKCFFDEFDLRKTIKQFLKFSGGENEKKKFHSSKS